MSTAPLSASAGESEADLARRLEMAREAVARYQTHCFWYLAPDFAVSKETLPLIVAGLRRYGDRAAFQLAALLCP